jgi:hypothetical protein
MLPPRRHPSLMLNGKIEQHYFSAVFLIQPAVQFIVAVVREEIKSLATHV